MKKLNIKVRPAREDDDITRIATCLYYTDPYIYPYLCGENLSQWIEIIKQCYTMPDNYYNYRNLIVATIDGQIAGIVCAIECGKVYTFSKGLTIPESLVPNISVVENRYFDPIGKANVGWKGYNILCFCVLQEFRRLGIGRQLMDWFLHSIDAAEVHLESTSDNVPAINLYTKSGFEIMDEYCGFEPNGAHLSCTLFHRAGRR